MIHFQLRYSFIAFFLVTFISGTFGILNPANAVQACRRNSDCRQTGYVCRKVNTVNSGGRIGRNTPLGLCTRSQRTPPLPCLVSERSTITTVAGNGTPDFSGDNGPAIQAQLSPDGITVDSQGNLFIADLINNRVRKVNANGIITTIVGNGVQGFSGDGAAAIQAQLNFPSELAFDSQGNLFITDLGNNRVRKVDTNGIITTVAGNGIRGSSGDRGPAIQAQLDSSNGIAVDSQAALYIVDNNRVRKVDTNGIISRVAGNGTFGFSGDGGPATQAQLNHLRNIALNSQGNLFIADTGNNRVRKVDANGIITTIAGSSIHAFSGDGGPAIQAGGLLPSALAFDSQGNLFIANALRIRKVDSQGIITTVAGNTTGNNIRGFSGDGGPAIQAQFDYIQGLVFDSQGNLFISDAANNRIRKITCTP